MSNVIVLGAGMVGSAMAKDLSKTHKVLLTDINYDVLKKVNDVFTLKRVEFFHTQLEYIILNI